MPTPVPVLTPVPVPVPVPVPSTVKPVVPETSYIDGLRIISLLPATYDLQPLRLRLLLQTPRNLHEKSFIIEVDPAAPLWVFDVNLRLLDLPDWPADLHFTHLKITEMLRKSHMKRLYCNLNGLTPRQVCSSPPHTHRCGVSAAADFLDYAAELRLVDFLLSVPRGLGG